MRKRRIAPSERMRQELMDGLVSEDRSVRGSAARREPQLILQRALKAEACLPACSRSANRRAPCLRRARRGRQAHRQVSDFLR